MEPPAQHHEYDLHLSTFLENPAGSIIIRREAPDTFIVLDINPAAEKVGGWPAMGRENIIGRNMKDIFDGLIESGLVDMYNLALSTQKAVHVGRFAYEDSMVPWSVFDITFTPLSSDALLITYIKITDQIAAEAKLRISTGELRRSHEELDNFVKIASHDLEAPLRKIFVLGNRLRDHASDTLDEKGRDYIERILGATTHMQTLIDALAKYAKVTANAEPFTKVNLNKVVQHVKTILEHQIQEVEGIVEVFDLDTIEADPLQIGLLFQNLIANALKFHKKGTSPVVHISGKQKTTDTTGEPSLYQIFIKDNGIGFDIKNLGRIFQPFDRLHGKSEYAGAGIGLAICNKIVERHNGEITAESKKGEGTTFILTLPYSQMESAA